jgi:hypothetical protein
MFFDNTPPYKPNLIHPEDQKTLDQITSPRSWDYGQFKRAISTIGVLGEGVSIPAYNRPDTIHLQGWREVIDDLLERQKQDGNEYARVVFVDYQKASTFFSDKITRGNKASARLNFDKPVSRPHSNPIGSIHVHPIGNMAEHGLSDTDYLTFISDKRQQVMAIVYGKSIMLAMKTSATPNNPDQEFLQKEIKLLRKEFFDDSQKHVIERTINLNKQICMQFGLTLYLAGEKDRDLLQRVNVVN